MTGDHRVMGEVTFTIPNSGKAFLESVEFDISYVLDLKNTYKSTLKIAARRSEIITRSKIFGAIEDGVDTVIDGQITADYVELIIEVPLDVEVEIRERVRKLRKDVLK